MKAKKSKNFKKLHKKVIKQLSSLKPAKAEDRLKGALSDVPNITEETLPEHRDKVLGEARKYIYPLKQSRHHFVRWSIGILVVAAIGFLTYTALELYYFQSTSDFIYSVSEVFPFPVAKAGSSWVSYYSYLFELKRNMHYYATQQGVNFASSSGKLQLTNLKKEAMSSAILNAYVSQLASKYNVSVSSSQVDNEITLVRNENRLGSNSQVLSGVLKDYWGWTVNDFRQELKQELLQQAVVAKLDKPVDQQAASVYDQLKKGADFSTLAQQYSDDTSTKGNGGQYPFSITPNANTVAPQITAEVFSLKPGQFSPVINTGYSLEIVKVLSVSGSSAQAAHIQFSLQPIQTYTNPLEKAHPYHEYISISN